MMSGKEEKYPIIHLDIILNVWIICIWINVREFMNWGIYIVASIFTVTYAFLVFKKNSILNRKIADFLDHINMKTVNSKWADQRNLLWEILILIYVILLIIAIFTNTFWIFIYFLGLIFIFFFIYLIFIYLPDRRMYS